MFHSNGLNRLLINYLIPSSLYNALPFRCLEFSIKYVHSLHHSKPRKRTNQFSKRSKLSSKAVAKKHKDDPKVYMRNTVFNIYRILKSSTWNSAKEQFLGLGIKWDSYTVNQVLKSHPPMEKAWLFFNWASGLKGFKHDQFTYTTMLDIFGEAGRIASMKHVFKQMQDKGIKIDAVTYTSLMHWISSSGDVEGAMRIWDEMKERCYPTVVSYTAYLKLLLDSKRVKEATNVYKEMLDYGITPNCYTYTVLMEYLVVDGKYAEALEIFNKMQEAGVHPDKAACNNLVQRCAKAGETRAMTQILQYMKENDLVLRYPVFLEALQTLEVANESENLIKQVNPHCATESISYDVASEFVGAADDFPIDTGMVMILLKKQSLLAVDSLLNGISDKNIRLDSWVVSAIIQVNCSRCRPDGAFKAFEYSIKMGVDLERTTFLALIGSLIRSETFQNVVDIVKEMITAGHSLGVYLRALLIYRLGRARRPTFARRIFNLLPEDHKCTATYTALISVHISAGSVEKALKVYKTMKKNGIHPSLGTYNLILAGLERAGRVGETENYRKEKQSLLIDDHNRNGAQMEQKICDLLFLG
ncbi:hypothetical protein K2173_006117 [Erythroxylum novogranatense]|uniref:Pentatricopeptide repeat-containing protein n=1 Tax=Erythroxylum novogranatense TaxID=1862640 RepID=A0AAV8TBZ3_9ROSI|nr:hypothetical protein K2173_006117 [Erythroxylum novogranatense]